jgi:PhzF family phenazine biosynthesis protein
MMSVRLWLVEAFADAPFGGNSAAICLLAGPSDAGWVQAVAAELRQPATAFVWPAGERFGLRWFVAAAELTLCGHGTLAAAHVLWETGRLPDGAPAHFETVSGPLAARRAGDLIALDFPAERVHEVEPPLHLIEALGVEPRAIARSSLDYLVELRSEQDVRAVCPDFARRGAASPSGRLAGRAGRPGADSPARRAPGRSLLRLLSGAIIPAAPRTARIR